MTIPEKHSPPTHFRKYLASAFKQDAKWYTVKRPLYIHTTEEDGEPSLVQNSATSCTKVVAIEVLLLEINPN